MISCLRAQLRNAFCAVESDKTCLVIRGCNRISTMLLCELGGGHFISSLATSITISELFRALLMETGVLFRSIART